MRPSVLALRALPMTFMIYVLEALVGVYAALPATLELAPALAYTSGPRLEALRLELLLELLGVARVSLRTLGLAALLVLVLGAWLQMSWLSAIAQPSSVQNAFARGARLTPRAWLVSLLVALLMLALAAPVLGAAYAMHRWLGPSLAPRTHDLALAGVLSLLVPLGWVGYVLHDLARARALRVGAARSAFGGLRVALRPRMLLRAVLAWLLGTGAVAAASLLAGRFGDTGVAAPLGLSLLQSALLLRLFARSLWLACAVAQIGQVGPEVVAAEEA